MGSSAAPMWARTASPSNRPASRRSAKGRRVIEGSVEEVRLLFDDAVVERLEAQPAGKMVTDLAGCDRGLLVVDRLGRTCRLREQLGLARALHRDEPPRRFVDGVTNGEEPVIAKDDGLGVTQRVGDALALLDVEHHAP